MTKFTNQVKEAEKELSRVTAHFRDKKRRTRQVRIEEGRYQRIQQESKASKRTISKTMDKLIDTALPPKTLSKYG
jgi:hypothetical protein